MAPPIPTAPGPSGLPVHPAPIDGYRAREISPVDAPALQTFFDANPLYFELVEGGPAGPGEAALELEGALPAGWPFTRQWHFGWQAVPDGPLVAMSTVTEDLLASGVWNVGLFILATRLHGSGLASAMFATLEDFARARGAGWMRLGVVEANPRAVAFWIRQGFREVRVRTGVEVERRVHTLKVMLKPLGDEPLDAYLARVPRDHPDSP